MALGLDVTSLDFSPTSPKSAQFSIAIPDTWDLGDISLEIHWSHGEGASAFGVVWKIFAVFLKDGSPILGALNDVSVADTGGTADDLFVAARTAIAPAGTPERGGHVGLIIQRNTDAAEDTLDVDARLLGVRLFFGAAYANENTRQEFPPIPTILDPETIVWRDAAIAAGGTFLDDSIEIANDLIVALKAKPYNAKVLWLLPLLGGNLATARMPLRDSFGVGIATQAGAANFVDGDFSQATGLQGDGASKMLGIGLDATQLLGIGYWENNYTAPAQPPVSPMGAIPFGFTKPGGFEEKFWLRVWSDQMAFLFGNRTESESQACRVLSAGSNGHYYGQRPSDILRELAKNGSIIATNTGSRSANGQAAHEYNLMGHIIGGVSLYYPGRCAAAYGTDATMDASEIADFHSLLETYLITPTGR